MNAYEAKKIFLMHFNELPADVQLAVKFTLEHWAEISKTPKKFQYPLRWLETANLPNEKWLDVVGYEGLYQVSNYGRVQSFQSIRPRILKPSVRNGYLSVTLHKGGDYQTFSIHILVAQHFVPNPENKPIVNHLDANRLNCRADNLEWGTYSENTQHALKMGALMGRASNLGRAVLTPEEVRKIRETYKPYDPEKGGAALARKFNVSESVIHNIIYKKCYKQIE